MEEATESHPRPLILPEILDKIFGYLRVADLKAARLVNWTWNNVTNRLIKAKCGRRMIGFSNKQYLRLRRYKFNRICDMHKFVNWVDRTKEKTEFPFTRILVQITFDPMDVEFLEAVAPFVEELWIQLDVRQGLAQSESPLFRLIDYPALKKLRLFYVECRTASTIEFWDALHASLRNFEIPEAPDALSIPPEIETNKKQFHYPHKVDTRRHDGFLATLLHSASTLESFSVLLDLDHQVRIRSNTTAIRECFTPTMRGLRFGYKVRALREFETTLPYDNTSLMRLNNLKVSTLKIAINRTTVDSTTFSKFLQSQSNWLKNLTITNELRAAALYRGIDWYLFLDQQEFYVDFPEMTALQSLTLRDLESGQIDRLQYRTISYRKQFPALKQITFLVSKNAAVRNFCRVADSSDTVTELSVQGVDNYGGVNYRYFSHAQFPNLRKLEICPPTFHDMIHVYEELSLLEHLCLYTSSYSFESSIFGCTCFPCRNDIDEPCRNPRYLSEEGRQLSISSLSRLKTLRLFSPGKVFLPDIACRRIMACPSLERLILESGYKNSYDGNDVAVEPIAVSDLMLNQMRTKFQVEVLTFDRMKENDRMIDMWCYD